MYDVWILLKMGDAVFQQLLCDRLPEGISKVYNSHIVSLQQSPLFRRMSAYVERMQQEMVQRSYRFSFGCGRRFWVLKLRLMVQKSGDHQLIW